MQVAEEENQSKCSDNEELINIIPRPNFKHKKYLKTKFENEKHNKMKKLAEQPPLLQAVLPPPAINIKREHVNDDYECSTTETLTEFNHSGKLKEATGTSSAEAVSPLVPATTPPLPRCPPPLITNIKREKDENECGTTEILTGTLSTAAMSPLVLGKTLPLPPNPPPVIKNIKKEKEDDECATTETTKLDQSEKSKVATEVSSLEIHLPLLHNLQPPLPVNAPSPVIIDLTENEDDDFNCVTTEPSEELRSNEITNSEKPRVNIESSERAMYKLLQGASAFCSNFQNSMCPIPGCKFIHATKLEMEHFFTTGYLPPHTLFHLQRDSVLKPPPPPPQDEEAPDVQQQYINLRGNKDLIYKCYITKTDQSEEKPSVHKFPMSEHLYKTVYLPPHALAHLREVSALPPPPPPPRPPPPPPKSEDATPMITKLKRELEDALYRYGNIKTTPELNQTEKLKEATGTIRTDHFEHNPTEIMCRNFVRGSCTKGSSCIYAHKIILSQLHSVYTFCRDFQNSVCTLPNCKFVHATVFEQEYFFRTGYLPICAIAHLIEKKSVLAPQPRVQEASAAPPTVHYNIPPPPPKSGIPPVAVGYNATVSVEPNTFSIQPYTNTATQKREWRAIDKVSSSSRDHDSGEPQAKKREINDINKLSDRELQAQIELGRRILERRQLNRHELACRRIKDEGQESQSDKESEIITFMQSNVIIPDVSPQLKSMLAVMLLTQPKSVAN